MKPKVEVLRSEIDGAWVVFIFTDPDGPENRRGPQELRVNLNDEPIYENPPFPDAP